MCRFHVVFLWGVTVPSNLIQHLPATDDMTYNIVDNKLFVLLEVSSLAVVSVIVIVHVYLSRVFACRGQTYEADADGVVDIAFVNLDGILTY